MVFELDIEIYFWMVDRAEIEDDQRNQVSIEKQRVVLYKDHSSKIENGVYFGKLMHAIRKTILKKSRKPFTLDPTLANLKDQSTKSVKQFNWNLVVSELKKFNIKVLKDKKTQIIETKSESVLNEILSKLKEYDENILIAGVNQKQQNDDGYRIPEDKPEINSEINYGYNGDQLERKYQFNLEADSQRQNNGGQPLSNIKSTAILLGAPTKKNKLEPLPQFDYNRNQQSVPQFSLAKRRQDSFDLNLSVDINSVDINETDESDSANISDLRQALNSVMFIFASLKQALEMRHNQVGGLLANQYKFLVHVCVKGMKGADYSKIINWYKLLFLNAQQLVYLLSNENEQIKPTFDVIKCGLFSKNSEVTVLCNRLFTKIIQILNDNADQGNILDLKFTFYEWLTLARVIPKITASPSLPKVKGRSPVPKPPPKIEKIDLGADAFMYEQGLKAFLRAHKRGNREFVESFALFLISAGMDNLVDLITNHLRVSCDNTLQYLEVIQDIQEFFLTSQKNREVVLQSGLMNVLIDILIQIADNQQNINQFNDSYSMEAVNLQNNEKQRALMLLVDFWRTNPQLIQSQENDGRTTEAIMSVLKKGCRDRSKAISILSMNLMFSLLDSFAADRNKYAPILYKALTFIMVDSYGNLELREEMLNNFINLFTNIPSMPIKILCDPLFKQIQINLEKQNNDNNILNPQSEYFTLNTSDFEFFMHIAIHPKLHANVAVQLLQIVTEISRKNIIFTRISLKLILTVLNRFENNTTIFEFCQSQIRTVMKIIYDQDGIKVDLYNLLIRDPKNRVYLQKKKQEFNLNASIEGNKAEFSNVVSKNSINFKLSTSPGKDHLQKTRGITAGGATFNHSDFLDDSDVQQVLNPANFQEESSQYLSLRTLEKMIVNQLQCFINTGIKVLVDYIRQQLIETYIKIEKKFKFKNKGLIYLLALYEKDVTKMLQYYYNEQTKVQKEKLKAKKQQRERELEEQRRLEQSSDQDLDESHHFSLEDLNDRNESNFEIPNKNISLRKQKQDTLQVPKPNQQSKLKSNRNSLNVISSNQLNEEQDIVYANLIQDQSSPDKQSRARSTSIKSVKSGLGGQRRSLGEPVGVRALSVGRAKDQIVLFDILQTNDYEIQKYVVWMKDRLKLYKAMFHKYATVSANKINIRKVTFDDIKDQQNTLSLTDVFSFLNDFKILQTYGQNSENIKKIKRDDIKSIIKMINLKNASTVRTQADLDITGFIEFVLQLGHFTHDRSQRPSIFLQSLFDHLKEISLASKQPLFQRLFQDPNATSIGNAELIRELTNKVNQDPHYQLPPGYIKFKQNVLIDRYDAPSNIRRTSERIGMEILDDIFNRAIGIHLLEPDSDNIERWGVKPDIFQQNLRKQTKATFSQIGVKHQFNPDEVKGRNQQKNNNIAQTITPVSKSSNDIGARKGFAVNSSVDLGVQKRKPPASTRNHPDKAGLRQSAIIMEDLIRAIEQQPPGSVSQTNLMDIYNNGTSSVARRGRTQNRYLKAKQEQEKEDKIAVQQKFEADRIRNEKIKKKLENFQKEKQQRQALDSQKKKDDDRKKKDLERKKSEQKNQLYNKIKDQHEETKLPLIQQQKEADRQNKIEEREVLKKKKEKANEKTQLRIQSLVRDFNQKKYDKIQEEEVKKQKEEELKKKQQANQDKLAKNRVSVAQRLQIDKQSRAEKSIASETASLSPERGARLKSANKLSSSINTASNKSPKRNQSVRQSSISNVAKKPAQPEPYQLPGGEDTGQYNNEQFYEPSQVFSQDPQQADQRSPETQRQVSQEVKAPIQGKNFWGRFGLGGKNQ